MTDYRLSIGEVASSGKPATYTCFGLGSCVGLFVHDRKTGNSAGAHVFLPQQAGLNVQPGEYFDARTAVEEILRRLERAGSNINYLRAKITGGANVTQLKSQEGFLNTQAVMKLLTKHKIFVAAMDVGGAWSRTVTFDSVSGNITVKIAEINETKVI